MEEKIIYYKDELNDEFSEAQIVPRKIDGSYKYVHKNPLWNLCAFLVQNILSMPIKLLYVKTKFGIKYEDALDMYIAASKMSNIEIRYGKYQ